MTAPADLILTNGTVHTLADPDETAAAVAVRDGEVVRVDDEYEVGFLEGAETEVVDLGGRVLLPGFVDAHTHVQTLGRYLVHADLSAADSPAECVDLLAENAHDDREWILGYGFDESTWSESRYLDRADLDAVSETRPVAAFREDMHVGAVNGVALERLRDEMPDEDVRVASASDAAETGEPTGVIVEDAVDAVYQAIEPDAGETRELLLAAQRDAHRKGVTAVHDMVRRSRAPQVYRQLDLDGDLALRVRLNYWSEHLDALDELGLRTNHGSEFVRTGGVKTLTDGSIGGRTAKVSTPYEDGEGTGQWVVSPAELDDVVARADAAGFQAVAHAIGDEAITAVLDAFERTDDPGAARHRVEHAEMLTDEHVERFAESGVVASAQPNFLKWAGPDGLYEDRIGTERRRRTNRYRDLLDAGAHLAFGSDCMPLSPLLGVHHAVNTPAEGQRLTVTEALRAYTLGGAYAGFDEDRMGTVEPGKLADLVVLERSPWEHAEDVVDIDVAMTVVDGEIAYDDR